MAVPADCSTNKWWGSSWYPIPLINRRKLWMAIKRTRDSSIWMIDKSFNVGNLINCHAKGGTKQTKLLRIETTLRGYQARPTTVIAIFCYLYMPKRQRQQLSLTWILTTLKSTTECQAVYTPYHQDDFGGELRPINKVLKGTWSLKDIECKDWHHAMKLWGQSASMHTSDIVPIPC